MGKRLVLVTILICALIFVVSLVFFINDVDRTEETGDGVTATSTDEREVEDDDKAAQERATTTEEVAGSEESDSVNCVARQEEELANRDYTEGSLLVSFDSSTSYVEVESVVSANGHELTESSGQDHYESLGWVEVAVPAGEEAEWICEYENEPTVRSAVVNATFRLHE